MSRFVCELRTKRSEGALVRVLSHVRRRRYEVVRLAMQTEEDGATFALTLTVEAERSPESLARYLAKLHDVTHVKISDDSRAATAG